MDQTFYYQHADGSLSVRTLTGYEQGHQPDDPDGTARIDAGEYEQAVAAIMDVNALEAARQEVTERATALADFTALRTLGMPDATARRLSGYLLDGKGPVLLPLVPAVEDGR